MVKDRQWLTIGGTSYPELRGYMTTRNSSGLGGSVYLPSRTIGAPPRWTKSSRLVELCNQPSTCETQPCSGETQPSVGETRPPAGKTLRH
uniref:Uncharacterized protein n=1 Tax=Romanomermis culicivorax TaxID=13658 RepID=A0A915L942_ROMCU